MTPFQCCNGSIQGVRWGQGRKILALHGFLDNALSFKPLAEQLPDVEIWSIDLPGHGLSAPMPKQDGTFILNWLIPLGRVLDDLDWPYYTILGHSLGAILSQLLAGLDPRIDRLLSLDALGPLASTSVENLARVQQLYDARERSFKRRQYASYSELIRSRRKGVFPLSEQAAATMASRAVKFNGDTWAHRYDAQLRNDSLWRMAEADVQAWLQRISVPVHLALFGAQYWPGYKSVFDERCASVSDIRVTPLDGSHHLHMEKPKTVARWFRAALTDNDRQTVVY